MHPGLGVAPSVDAQAAYAVAAYRNTKLFTLDTSTGVFVYDTDPSKGQSPSIATMPYSTKACDHPACINFGLAHSRNHVFLRLDLPCPTVVGPEELRKDLDKLLEPSLILHVPWRTLSARRSRGWLQAIERLVNGCDFIITYTPPQAESSVYEVMVTLKRPQGGESSIDPDLLGGNWHVVFCLRSLATSMAQWTTWLQDGNIGAGDLQTRLLRALAIEPPVPVQGRVENPRHTTRRTSLQMTCQVLFRTDLQERVPPSLLSAKTTSSQTLEVVRSLHGHRGQHVDARLAVAYALAEPNAPKNANNAAGMRALSKLAIVGETGRFRDSLLRGPMAAERSWKPAVSASGGPGAEQRAMPRDRNRHRSPESPARTGSLYELPTLRYRAMVGVFGYPMAVYAVALCYFTGRPYSISEAKRLVVDAEWLV
ncbi:hypothetical protein Purlil1_11509 [Purpureocillium lilacinum]|uniref:Uncharacterized protein n=1 Tax=Purpureocillium lilacinum TaxID=33203 RepID=A0ABR0BJJ8_PURLI|nr:hypothetical protein Purlil1_11509 [Purpureocillium lilacinum]